MDISNSADTIDSRDVIERINEIEGEAQGRLMAENEEKGEGTSWGELADIDAAMERLMDTDDVEEWRRLTELAEEGESLAGDWTHGATLIRDSYFKTYAQDLAEDIGAINRDASWPATCIDWDKAVRELQMDYSEVDYDGESYWVRS